MRNARNAVSLPLAALLMATSPLAIRAQLVEASPVAPVGEKGFTSDNLPDARFSAGQIALVTSWIERETSECSPEILTKVVAAVLAELKERRPVLFDQLADFPVPTSELRSVVLRHLAAKLMVLSDAPLRVELARRRVLALAPTQAGDTASPAPQSGEQWLEKIKTRSDVFYRRLLDGKLEDDDLVLLLASARAPHAGTSPDVTAATASPLLAMDILGEFARRNQNGAAWQKFAAYQVRAKLHAADGSTQDIILLKLRPAKFRLTVMNQGLSHYLLAGDGERFWQRSTTLPFSPVSGEALGGRRHLGEFENALFRPEGYQFERLPDGVVAEKPVYRIALNRADGSGYTACIDQASYREVAREISDGSVVRYDDFREVAGVTFAFREVVTDASGRTGSLQIETIAPNPGVLPAFFQPPPRSGPDFFALERLWGASAAESQP
ncbi:hypothetical protein [Oleiharenicola lentus]|uniref:hypothetical protein n=1 Tax=Oleiharenicola lentus TaxID=2508720 RepID=UPI003F66661C